MLFKERRELEAVRDKRMALEEKHEEIKSALKEKQAELKDLKEKGKQIRKERQEIEQVDDDMKLEIRGMQKHREVVAGLIRKLKMMSSNISSSNVAQESIPTEPGQSVDEPVVHKEPVDESYVHEEPGESIDEPKVHKEPGNSDDVPVVHKEPVGSVDVPEMKSLLKPIDVSEVNLQVEQVRSPAIIPKIGFGNPEVVQQLLASARALAPSEKDGAAESTTVSSGKKFKIQEYGSFVRDINAAIEMISFLREHTVARQKFITKLQTMKKKKIGILVTLIQIQRTYTKKFYFSRKTRRQRQLINESVTKYIEDIKHIEMLLHKYRKKSASKYFPQN